MPAGKTKNSNLLDRIRKVFSRRARPPTVRKTNRTTSVDVDRSGETSGIGQDWAKRAYGEYYATSVPIYSAIKVRSEALAQG